jgi:hypothetical protein
MIADYTIPTRARNALGGLLLLALAAFGLTDATADPAEPSGDMRHTPVSFLTPAVDGPVAADETFETLYSLPDGEILKRVAPPSRPADLLIFERVTMAKWELPSSCRFTGKLASYMPAA